MAVFTTAVQWMERTLFLSAMVVPGLVTAGDSMLKWPVQPFSSNDEPAVGAIIRFGRENKIPLGLIVDDRLCSTNISGLRIAPGTIEHAVAKLAQVLPSYYSNLEAGVIVFAPVRTSTAVARFLAVVPPRYIIPEDTLQGQLAWAWIDIRAALRPREGSAFDILSSPAAVMWPALTFGDITIRDLLNRLVARKDGAVWVLWPLMDFDTVADRPPIVVMDYIDTEAPTMDAVSRACKGAP